MKRYSTTIYTLLLICQPIRAFVELFHSSCNACVQYNSCEDLYIKTRQGFPSDNVNNNVDVQQGNNSNDVENLDDVIQKMTSLPRAKIFDSKKSSNFVLFSYLFIDFSVEHYWKHGKQIFLHKTKFENFRKI